MNELSFSEIAQVSHIECEEYFPLRVVFDSSIGENRFVGFYCGEDSLLEFTVSRETNAVKKLQIVTCRDYKINDTNLVLPQHHKSGCIHLANSQHNDCDLFSMSIYADGIVINISQKDISKYYAMGQVLFGVGEDNELISLVITNLSVDERSHAIVELQAE